jgi:GNAT superfamily N-acetyltransferase
VATVDTDLKTGMLPSASARDGAVTAALADLVNEVYAAAEDGLWVPGAARTSAAEIAGFARAGEIAVTARGGRLLGCVRITRLDGDSCEFGMLAVTPGDRGLGIGRDLVRFAERRARDLGCATMQLELLMPRGWKHPSKEFLARWYQRMDYTAVATSATEVLYPDLSPLLATPCEFVIYRKCLTALPRQTANQDSRTRTFEQVAGDRAGRGHWLRQASRSPPGARKETSAAVRADAAGEPRIPGPRGAVPGGGGGVRQFLDIGSGLPMTQNVHQIAQAAAPSTRVVYVDNDPLVLTHPHPDGALGAALRISPRCLRRRLSPRPGGGENLVRSR